MFIASTMMLVSWLSVYIQIHKILNIKYVMFLFTCYSSKKLNKPPVHNVHSRFVLTRLVVNCDRPNLKTVHISFNDLNKLWYAPACSDKKLN